MMTSLNSFIDPASYHPEAIAKAGKGAITQVDTNLLIIRLGIELHREDRDGAQKAIARLETENRQGYELFQLLTAKIILALWAKDDDEIMATLEAWLVARNATPENWCHDVLDAPELAPYAMRIDPARLRAPEAPIMVVTKADKAMLKDLAAAKKQAVTENLPWLQQVGVTGTIASIAKAYRITYANHDLREVTLSAQNDWPDLIVSVDNDGMILGSFLAH